MAAVYTHGHHDAVLRSHRWRTAANSAAYLVPVLRAGQRLLDVGCGPGTITVDLAGLVAPGAVVGIDRAAAPLGEARRGADQAGVALTFAVGDGAALAHPDASFDVVHAHQVLQHVADPVVALAEMRRVCRPGGYVAARDADYAAMAWYPAQPLLERWRSVYRALARANGGEPDAGRHLLAWARAAGFAEVRASASVWCFATPDDRAWWGETWADRVTQSAYADQAVARGLLSADDLGPLAAAWRAWSVDPDAWFAVVHGEVLCRR